MKKTKKEIIEMCSFIQLMSIIYKEMGNDLFNNLQEAIAQIPTKENEENEEEIKRPKITSNLLK